MQQIPPPGSQHLCYRGDVFRFRLLPPPGSTGRAFLRTTLGRADVRREEVIAVVEEGRPRLAHDWHDIPMRLAEGGAFELELPLLEVGHYEAKALFVPAGSDEVVWAGGDNVRLKVEAATSVRANGIYTAFVRAFGPNRGAQASSPEELAAAADLERSGHAVLPPSGTFRDLVRELDFIVGVLGFRNLLLLPIHPTPTVYGRMGRFGSPFAALDFLDVDPALAEFDRKTTPLDQLRELVDAVHRREARVFMDIPVNHTGWASRLHVERPEWFERNADGSFRSPGAWGVTWADLVQLNYADRELWRALADVFLFWCGEGVDGFRCDAGYKVPHAVWEYVTAKVRASYPDTVFLLEGLGGKLEVTSGLLETGGLDWAYSELFQNYDRGQLGHYLGGAIEWSERLGTLVHFAETHDNSRLAATSSEWARMRTALAALCSPAGAFGITCGVEWYAREKIDVHEAHSLAWGSTENQVAEVARLNALLAGHPAFAGGSSVRLRQVGEGNVLALERVPRDGGSGVTVLVNLETGRPQTVEWEWAEAPAPGASWTDLVSGREVPVELSGGRGRCRLEPGEVLCLSRDVGDLACVEAGAGAFGGALPEVVRQRARAHTLSLHTLRRGFTDVSDLDLEGEVLALLEDPAGYCARTLGGPRTVVLTRWSWPRDLSREVMVPPGHLLLVEAAEDFSASLRIGARNVHSAESLPRAGGGHFALLVPPAELAGATPARLSVRAHGDDGPSRAEAPLLLLPSGRSAEVAQSVPYHAGGDPELAALCTNGRGAMAQVRGDWGALRSQYDCLLGANLHPDVPVDRHVLLTRLRFWLVYQGYSHELGAHSMTRFEVAEGGDVRWSFRVPAGDGRALPLTLRLSLQPGRNALRLQLARGPSGGEEDALADEHAVSLILRPDVEDRNCHAKTKAYAGPEQSFGAAVEACPDGFRFGPDPTRRIVVRLPGATWTREPEWCYAIAHPEEAQRGLDGLSDLYSPGYFELSLRGGEEACLTAEVAGAGAPVPPAAREGTAEPAAPLALGAALREAIGAFVVARDDSLSVIAGYPWFLDWGRDTLIALRGIIAAGRLEEARDILHQFARFEREGTLPNTIHGEDTSNRDTSDAPLWFFAACRDLLRAGVEPEFLEEDVGGRSIREVLRSIAVHYRRGTPNGVRVDPGSGLVWSPAHYTWMDTNYPAGTPREGYAVEIQALWHHALRFLVEVGEGEPWAALAEEVAGSIRRHHWRPELGWLADCLHAPNGEPASAAAPDDALRPNQLFALTLGAVSDPVVGEASLSACQELLVPGAIRTLADRPLMHPLHIERDGEPLCDPRRPYRGVYGGDEDSSRKPAYHNGTAWTWPFPSYCEALVGLHGEPGRATATALLASVVELLERGCLGQLPEILDGDHPHHQRGCKAQAWSATEAYRVWRLLTGGPGETA